MTSNKVYLVGSLRNPRVPEVAVKMRDVGFDVYDDWYAVGPEADDHWKDYERGRGRDYLSALSGWHARHVFEMDKQHLDEAAGCVLVLPAGKSGHLEFGYMIGQKRWGVILLEEEDDSRFDIMYRFATHVVRDIPSLLSVTQGYLR